MRHVTPIFLWRLLFLCYNYMGEGMAFLSVDTRVVINGSTPSFYWQAFSSYCNPAQYTPGTTRCNAYKHALAILTMPVSSLDRIANEAVLETVLSARSTTSSSSSSSSQQYSNNKNDNTRNSGGSGCTKTSKLSIVLRCCRPVPPSTAALRRYVGEIYSQLWDACVDCTELPDAVVYPQNLPNSAPESWIVIQPDLDCVCGHDDVVGTSTIGSKADDCETDRVNGHDYLPRTDCTGVQGGLDEHVANINSERLQRGLFPVTALHVPQYSWDGTVMDPNVIFLDDDIDIPQENNKNSSDDKNFLEASFLSGASDTPYLFESVCVGGTFDGLHFGHRKLLTLAASSVNPVTGRLLVGVTSDSMLQNKHLAEMIPPFEERCDGVRNFLHRLAPGTENRLSIVPITDSFGPPGQAGNTFDALVLSHETLETGLLLNRHRVVTLHLPPLALLCTRRTEAHGMSSTALRQRRLLRQQNMPTENIGKRV